eukprot:TRINITY_DN1976_c0_g1_i7.p1 TRINITY_DN1976_c0_g1~~TRINITY_DN1976_c0_g1_i7.p1  ORF type:complete len:374 (+),score=82.13 TRINITY_DN1976_c0_g1_i7:55-1176(+)
MRWVILLFLLFGTIFGTSIESTIGYQLHSWNDLREWRAGFKKGADWFKIDLNYQDYKTCSAMRPWKDERGCFLLTHDNPISAVKVRFNTSDDLLDMMDENPELFQQNEIHIALCFKTGFTLCDGGMEFFNWTSLIDDFYDRANQIISKHSLKVEFILDGSAPVTDETECLKDKWRPWVYTYVSFRNPALAYFENWTRDGYDRFAILNEPVDSIDPTFLIKMVAISDYGKFSKQQKYPYLNWEPNNQKPIKEVIDVYLDKGLVQEAGFKFAINMDPVQLEVYAGSLSKKAWNERLPITTDFRPLMTVLPFSGENVIVKLQRTKKDCVSYEIMSNTVQFGPIKSMVTGKTDCYLQSINSISSIVSGQNSFQILVR